MPSDSEDLLSQLLHDESMCWTAVPWLTVMLCRQAQSCIREHHNDCSTGSKVWASHFKSSTFPSEGPTKIWMPQLKRTVTALFPSLSCFPSQVEGGCSLNGKIPERSLEAGLGKVLEPSSFMSSAIRENGENLKMTHMRQLREKNVYYGSYRVITIYKILCTNLSRDCLP